MILRAPRSLLVRICLAAAALPMGACTGPDQETSTAPLLANVATLGDATRNLGQVFTEPPRNIGSGDGFAPQPFVNGDGNAAVMVVAHHQTGLHIGALDLVTTTRITPLRLGGSEQTSNGFGYVQDPDTKRFYVPTSTGSTFTYSCINGNFRPSQGESPTLCAAVTPSAGTPARTGSDLSADGLAIYRGAIFGALGSTAGELQVTCADAFNNNCSGYPKVLATDYQPGANNVRFQDLGSNKIAIGFNRTGGQVSAVCFDMVTQAACGRVDSTANSLTSQPLGYFSGSQLTGFCAFSAEQMNNMACEDLAGTAIGGLQVTTANQGSAQYGMATRMPNSGKYIITSLGGSRIECLDMANAGASCGSTPNFTGTTASPYGSAFHQNSSTGDLCLLTYNDPAQLGIFRVDATTGGLTEDLRCFAPGGVNTTWRVSDPVPQVCANANGVNWNTLTVTTGPLTLDGVEVTQTYGGDISVLEVPSGRLVARQRFSRTGGDIGVDLAALGVEYSRYPTLDIRLRVLQNNDYELRAGHQMTASLQVRVSCGR